MNKYFLSSSILINHIKFYRIVRGITQLQLSDITGISQNTISDYENYKCLPSILHAFRLSNALDVSLYDLFVFDYDSFFKNVEDKC